MLKARHFKKEGAFTLLELIIVIMIIGVLATLGVRQYNTTIEKSRYAEARQILGALRKAQKAYYLQYGAYYSATYYGGTILESLGIDPPPGATCLPSHYFHYYIRPAYLAAVAVRCTSGGKYPDAASACEIDLQYDICGTKQDGQLWMMSTASACLPYSP